MDAMTAAPARDDLIERLRKLATHPFVPTAELRAIAVEAFTSIAAAEARLAECKQQRKQWRESYERVMDQNAALQSQLAAAHRATSGTVMADDYGEDR